MRQSRADTSHRTAQSGRSSAARMPGGGAGRRGALARAGQDAGLVEVVQQLSLSRSLPKIQEIVRRAARRLTGADGATFVLRDGERCFYADEDAIAPLWKGQRFPIESCISGWSMLHRAPALIPDIYSDQRIPHEAYRPTFVRSLAMVPIRRLDPIGAIGNYWATWHEPTAREVQVLQALADSTAVALENLESARQLAASQLETLRRLALAAEYRDDNTHQHTERVARTAHLLALALGWSGGDAERLRLAAPLHDIGKLAVPDALLLKPGRLTPEEYEQMKGHAAAGAAILADSHSEVLRLAEQVARTHHEWWDGSGYPAGLRGEAIHPAGRIVALADVFDALTHARPYKPAWSVPDALAEVERLRERQFDPRVVDAFAQLDAGDLVELPGAG